jgi:hypothetical protein
MTTVGNNATCSLFCSMQQQQRRQQQANGAEIPSPIRCINLFRFVLVLSE